MPVHNIRHKRAHSEIELLLIYTLHKQAMQTNNHDRENERGNQLKNPLIGHPITGITAGMIFSRTIRINIY